MSARFPRLHAPRWLRAALRAGHDERRPSALPVVIVVALSLAAGAVRLVAAASEPPPGYVAVAAGVVVPARTGADAGGSCPTASAVDMPPAAVEAIRL